MADVVGKRGNGIKIRQNNFDEMLKLLLIKIQGVQLEKSGIPDELKMKIRSVKKAPTKTIRPYFLRVGSNKSKRQPCAMSKFLPQIYQSRRTFRTTPCL
jgi:hypothetical protein